MISGSDISLHMGEGAGFSKAYYRARCDAGLPIIAKSVDNVGKIWEAAVIAAEYPHLNHCLVLRFPHPYQDDPQRWDRFKHWLSPQEAGRQLAAGLLWRIDRSPELRGYEHLVAIQLTCEDRAKEDRNDPNWGNLYPTEYTALAGRAAAEIMMQRGFQVVLDGFNAGEPEPEDWERPERAALIDWILEQDGRVMLGFNESCQRLDWRTTPLEQYVPWVIGRISQLPKRARKIKKVICEWAYANDDVKQHDAALIADWDFLNPLYLRENVVGVFLWATHNSTHNSGVERKLSAKIPLLEQYNLDRWFEVEADDSGGEPVDKTEFDMVDYFVSDGKIRPIRTSWAGEFPIQVIHDTTRREIFILKGSEMEHLYYDDEWIYRGIDTSEGQDRFYVQTTDGIYGAVWLPRFAKVGDVQVNTPLVIHYWKDGGERKRGNVRDVLKIESFHERMTLPSGIVADDVIVISWNGGEGYTCAPVCPYIVWTADRPDENGRTLQSHLARLSGDDGRLQTTPVWYAIPPQREWYFRPKSTPEPEPEPQPVLSFEQWAKKVVQSHDSFVQWIDTKPEPAIRRELRDLGCAVQSSEVEAVYPGDGRRYVLGAGREFEAERDNPIIVGFEVGGSYQTKDRRLVGQPDNPVEPTPTPGPEPEPEPIPSTEPFAFKVWPAPGNTRVTQWYGANKSYYQQWGLDGHEGVDVAASKGSPIVAVADGVVSRVVDARKSKAEGGHNYGVHVRVDHGGGYESIYAHFDSRSVEVGQRVTAGQRLGAADSTGNSSGHHLHFSLKKDGVFIDPTEYLMSVFPV